MTYLSDGEQRLWHAWKRATDSVRSLVAEEISAATGLSDPDFGILTRLEDLGGGTLRQSELAASMGWHRSRLSHQLTRMEDRGLVLRDSAAGPGVAVSVTAAGSAIVRAARPVHAKALRRHLISRLPASEVARITSILEELADQGEPATRTQDEG